MDGTSDTDFHHGHCSHTLLNSPSWWRVDLGLDPVPVSEVYIANRFSTNELIRQRNKDYKITIGESFCRNSKVVMLAFDIFSQLLPPK